MVSFKILMLMTKFQAFCISGIILILEKIKNSQYNLVQKYDLPQELLEVNWHWSLLLVEQTQFYIDYPKHCKCQNLHDL